MRDQEVRIFYALWPDAMTRRKIQRVYDGVGPLKGVGRPVRLQNLHMTLHFIGNVAESMLPCYLRAGDAVRVSPFTLKLNSCGGFANARVSWLGCHVFPLQLSQLHEQLGRQLVDCGFAVENRPFRPHVTMARKVRGEIARQGIETIRWPVERFVLLQSEPVEGGVRYRVRHSWPLAG